MELLAPAGEKEIALAALRAGADACYVGGLWSARAYAKNFDERDLLDTLDFAHAHGKKVYVALNTMLDTRELADALSYTGRLYDAGVDAIIAADLGYIAEAHARFPGLALHASTQAGVQSAAGAALLQSLGCTRVVAARECASGDRSRGVLPRGDVLQRVRRVPAVRRARRAQRQPWPVRAALPAGISPARRKGIFFEHEGFVHARPYCGI